jgi:CRP/FNR family transcriptional regulator
MDPGGEEVIMHFGVRGDALGIMSTMEGESKFPFDAVAMGESEFLKIPKWNFATTWVRNPAVMLRFQTHLQGRIFRSHDEKRFLKRPLAERIADLLLYLSEHKTARTGWIDIPITRREIAGYVGATVESVIRTMSGWSREGVVETFDRHIVVHDRGRLLDIRADQIGESESASSGGSARGLVALWQKTGVSTQCAREMPRDLSPERKARQQACAAARKRSLSFAH